MDQLREVGDELGVLPSSMNRQRLNAAFPDRKIVDKVDEARVSIHGLSHSHRNGWVGWCTRLLNRNHDIVSTAEVVRGDITLTSTSVKISQDAVCE